MKKIFALLFITFFFFSCKKDTQTEKQILLSVEYSDGAISRSYNYNNAGQLTRLDAFNNSLPGNPLSAIIEVEYNTAGKLSLITTYAVPGTIALSRLKLTLKPDGKIDTVYNYDLQGSDPGNPTFFRKYIYNTQGKLSQIISKDKNGAPYAQENYSYHSDGTLKMQESFRPAGPVLYKTLRKIYSFPGTKYPPGIAHLHIFGEGDFADFFNESIQHYNYSQAGVITFNQTFQMSGREYNADGSLKKQVSTTKYIIPAHSDKVTQKSYEYITQ